MKLSTTTGHIRKAITPIAQLSGVAVGVTTTLNVATAKFTGYPRLQDKAIVFISKILGPNVTGQIFNLSPSTLPAAGITPSGILSPAARAAWFPGAVGLAFDYFIGPYISRYGYSWVRPFVKSISAALVAGGVVGGLFDPEPTQGGQPFLSHNPIQPLMPSTHPATRAASTPATSQPFLSVQQVKLHGR